MNSTKFFFICSCIIFILSGINFSLGPMNNFIRYNQYGGNNLDFSYAKLNCKKVSDDLEEYKKNNYFTMSLDTYEDKLYELKECRYKVGTYTMERVSFNLNIIFGFICVLIGLFGFEDNKIPKGNLIAMICGIIGFLSTLAYVIFAGTYFTQFYLIPNIYKRDSDGAIAEYEDMKGFRCNYFSGIGNKRAFIAKYSDYIKSQYNYNKKLSDFFEADENKNCVLGSGEYDIKTCATKEYLKFNTGYYYKNNYENCTKLYYKDGINSQDLTALYVICSKYLSVLVLSVFMLPIYCALIFFAFTLSKDSSGYSQL